MARLEFITKGNQNLKGKSKVYFCAHPKDYGSTFRNIADDILETPNCVIWYDAQPQADWDEEQHFSNLAGMQLFVIPVTRHFLYENNRAFSKELPYARKQHIPVLPILEDGELERVFEEKCGNLQSLKKIARGPQALPYKDRLRKYLNTVLIGDQWSREILKSFDASIFLAYRKADRAFAHQFMQIVHENPRFRNIAIWYDEFLSVGEDFSSEIDETIKDSDIFAMVVTPNIIVKDTYNYVKEHEYPAAAKYKKNIMPVEFLKTDPSEIQKEYIGIPECIRAENKDGLCHALESALTGIQAMQNANEPQRQFLLGLAYLGGVGLEKNKEYAVQYITLAAEAGHAKAMERLVTMYMYGDSVAQNITTAISWQSRLAGYYQSLYEKTKERESGIHAVFEQHKLYEYSKDAGQEDGALELCLRMRITAHELLKKYPRDYSSIECLVISLSDISDFSYRHNDIVNAKKINRLLLPLNKILTRDTDLSEASEDLMINFQKLGIISEKKNDFQSALKYYSKSLAISTKMKDRDSSDETYRRWIDNLYRVGHCYLRLHCLDKASNYFNLCLKEYKSLKNTSMELWRTYDALSRVCCQKLDLIHADYYCDQSIPYAKEVPGIEGQRCLAESYCIKAGNLTQQKDHGADKYFQLALNMLQDIYKVTQQQEDREKLWETWGMYGDYFLTADNTAKAKKYYEKYLNDMKNVSQNNRSWNMQLALAQGLTRMGFIANREGDAAKAREYFTESITTLKRIRKNTPALTYLGMLRASKIALKRLK